MSEKPDFSGMDREHLEAKLWHCQEAYLLLKADLEERTDQFHLAHAKILSREAINAQLAGENDALITIITEVIKTMEQDGRFPNAVPVLKQELDTATSSTETRIVSHEQALTKFWNRLCAKMWDLWELDGGTFQDWGEELGLLRKEIYDPEKHGLVEAEPGDEIFVNTLKDTN